MFGRAIDQLLPFPCDPKLEETYVKDARMYLELAESQVQPPVAFRYPWGEALQKIDEMCPDVRIINLETSITNSQDFWPGKEVTYRMSPENAQALREAKIDCVCLANNHVLDFGYKGLEETLETLKKLGIQYAGAGFTLDEVQKPAFLPLGEETRVLIFSVGFPSSGVPKIWGFHGLGGVFFLKDYSESNVQFLRTKINQYKTERDTVILSIHWGSNWDYTVYPDEQGFAHRLIDEGVVDIIFGHSSHHAKGIEVYRDKLILYGCGDLINDYEGIGGHDYFRGNVGALYFPTIDSENGRLLSLRITPTYIKDFKINLAGSQERKWLQETLNREGHKLGTKLVMEGKDFLLQWKKS